MWDYISPTADLPPGSLITCSVRAALQTEQLMGPDHGSPCCLSHSSRLYIKHLESWKLVNGQLWLSCIVPTALTWGRGLARETRTRVGAGSQMALPHPLQTCPRAHGLSFWDRCRHSGQEVLELDIKEQREESQAALTLRPPGAASCLLGPEPSLPSQRCLGVCRLPVAF